MNNLEHSCDSACQCQSPAVLKPGQFETVLFVYGYLQDGIILARGTALKMAGMMAGTPSRMFDGGPAGQLARILSMRLVDDMPSDSSKGRVVAVCELVEEPRCQAIMRQTFYDGPGGTIFHNCKEPALPDSNYCQKHKRGVK